MRGVTTMIWLGIDTANTPLSIAIVKDGKVLTEENTSMPINHSLRAMPAIEEAFERAKLKPADLDGIVVAEGPGSYTGVRIGVTIAKTLAWTLNKPLIGISSLQSLATNGLFFTGLICPIVDARRKHVYAGVYQSKGGKLSSKMEDQHIGFEALVNELNAWEAPILFIGPDIELYREELEERLGERAIIAPFQFNLPKASSLIYAAEQQDGSEDIHHFVPQYRRIAEAEANWLKANRKG